MWMIFVWWIKYCHPSLISNDEYHLLLELLLKFNWWFRFHVQCPQQYRRWLIVQKILMARNKKYNKFGKYGKFHDNGKFLLLQWYFLQFRLCGLKSIPILDVWNIYLSLISRIYTYSRCHFTNHVVWKWHLEYHFSNEIQKFAISVSCNNAITHLSHRKLRSQIIYCYHYLSTSPL